MNIHFAPVQGHTDAAYRHFHALCYQPASCYYTPFIRWERGEVRRRDLRDMENVDNSTRVLVPQVIFRDADELRPLIATVKGAGAYEIDINMGCPFPLQTARGRGAALSGSAEAAALVKEVVAENPDVRFSVKLRLGLNERSEWKQSLPVLNQIPLKHITLHPRVARQQYGGDVDMEMFREFYESSTNPVIYNGDLKTPEDVARIADEFPDLAGIMLGRGLLGRPSLTSEIAAGEEWPLEKRLECMLEFHRRLLHHYQESLCGDTQLISKIQPFWEYAEAEIGRKAWKAIRKASNMAKYNSAVAMIGRNSD